MKAKAFAQHLLYFKEHGYTIGSILRKSRGNICSSFYSPFSAFSSTRSDTLAHGSIVYHGTGRRRRRPRCRVDPKNKKVWGHYDSMIDWSKVRQIAEKETNIDTTINSGEYDT